MTPSSTQHSIGAQPPSVLVVDDMEPNRAMLSRRLEKLGFAVTCVESGPQALTRLRDWQPDIVLLDYMMPQMNGIEVLLELRAMSATRELPVIMVTARAESEATVEALAAGADDYVTKPIDFDVLKARIETQLGKCSDAMQLRRANAALDERITMRSMVLADLEGELKDEIRRRHDLERQLASAPSASSGGAPQAAALLDDISSRFESLFEAMVAGRAANLAQMAELRGLIARARDAVR